MKNTVVTITTIAIALTVAIASIPRGNHLNPLSHNQNDSTFTHLEPVTNATVTVTGKDYKDTFPANVSTTGEKEDLVVTYVNNRIAMPISRVYNFRIQPDGKRALLNEFVTQGGQPVSFDSSGTVNIEPASGASSEKVFKFDLEEPNGELVIKEHIVVRYKQAEVLGHD